MGAFERITVELPGRIAERLRARVAAGEFATESDAIIEALLALDAPAPSNNGIDTWLQGPIIAAYDDVKSGKATLLTHEEMCSRLGIAAE